MKVRAYEEAERKEKIVQLKLVTEAERTILVAVDEEGHEVSRGQMLAIHPHGITLFLGVGEWVGLPLGEGGVVKVEVEK